MKYKLIFNNFLKILIKGRTWKPQTTEYGIQNREIKDFLIL